MRTRKPRIQVALAITYLLAVAAVMLLFSRTLSSDEAGAHHDAVLTTPMSTYPPPVCTAPACEPGEVYYCPDACPGGCGTECATPTPTPSQLLPLLMRNVTIITGEYLLVGNPCTTDPCLPCVVYAVRAGGTTYHLTVDGHWLCSSGDDPPSWDGYAPQIGDRVTVGGQVSEGVDRLGHTYYDIEVAFLKPAQ